MTHLKDLQHNMLKMTWTLSMDKSFFFVNVKYPITEPTCNHLSLLRHREAVPVLFSFKKRDAGHKFERQIIKRYTIREETVNLIHKENNPSMMVYYPNCVSVKMTMGIKPKRCLKEELYLLSEEEEEVTLVNIFDSSFEYMKEILMVQHIVLFSIDTFTKKKNRLTIQGIMIDQNMDNISDKKHIEMTKYMLTDMYTKLK
jgi:hypothetical protein